jgi:S1-C subfamily serine protease
MKFPSCSLLVLGVLVCTASPGARALPESEATAGRLVARRYAEAIIQVKGTVVLKIKIGLRALPQTERKIDICGTVIGASGLTVTSLSAVDPKSIFESMRAQMNSGPDPVELGETEFKNMRLRMADGSEIPAKILWRDVDHDLVLLAPDQAAASNRAFTFVDLNQGAESASVLGTYYHLSRAGEELQRVLLVRASTVTGVVERPRRLLLISTDVYPDALGCPVFDANGRALGICLHILDKGLPKGTVLAPAVDLAAAIALASPD